jgi:hypothetical protein
MLDVGVVRAQAFRIVIFRDLAVATPTRSPFRDTRTTAR